MNDDLAGDASDTEAQTDWERVRSICDDEIHADVAGDPEIHPTDELFWQQAHVVMPRRKMGGAMWLDADARTWFL